MRPPDRVTRSALQRAVEAPAAAIDRALNRGARSLAARTLPFYRRHPYRGGLGLFTADMRGAYSPEDGFFYNRVPKAANSTVMKTLAEHAAFSRRLGRDRAKSRFLRPTLMSASQVAALDATFRFTFVRDPYARVLSAFADKVLRKRRQARGFYDRIGGVGEGPPDFVAFLRYLEAGGLHADAHWAPQADLMLLPVADFDLVGRVETLGRDLATVLDRVFGAPPPERLRRAGPRTDAAARFAEIWTPEAVALVNALYAADFELFGYRRRPA